MVSAAWSVVASEDPMVIFSTAALKWIARIELNIGDDVFWIAIRAVEPASAA